MKTIDPPIPMYSDRTKSIPDDGLYLFVLMGYYYKHETNNKKKLRGRDLLCVCDFRKCTFYKIKQKHQSWLFDTGMEAIIESLFSSFRFRLPLSSTIEYYNGRKSKKQRKGWISIIWKDLGRYSNCGNIRYMAKDH